MAYGWDQMRQFTDEVGENAATSDPRRWTYTANGSLDTAGTINPESAPSLFGAAADRLFAPITHALDAMGMSEQGYSQQWYDTSLPSWLGGGENGVVAQFINAVSKVHDFYEGWDYDVPAGARISRGATFNGLYDLYGMAGMVPAGAYTTAALSSSTVYALQNGHR
jgi:hypothetical protein